MRDAVIMAFGSWQGLYNAVIDALMDERREQELLLLMAIARHADRLGFAFPGRARLMAKRHCSQPVYDKRLSWLIDRQLVRVDEGYDYRRRQKTFDFQVSPRVLYVREEFQEYCERVFDGLEDRNLPLEKWLLENHFSTNDSQPESEPETESDAVNQTQEPDVGTRRKTSDANRASEDKKAPRQGRTTGNARHTQQPPAGKQPPAGNATAHRKNNPQAGGRDGDEFSDLLSPTVDDDRLIAEIRHVASTTEHQARDAVATYPRDAIVHWLRITGQRRARGELKNPGGYFFKCLKSQTPYDESLWPEWAQQQKQAQDDAPTDDDLSELEI